MTRKGWLFLSASILLMAAGFLVVKEWAAWRGERAALVRERLDERAAKARAEAERPKIEKLTVYFDVHSEEVQIPGPEFPPGDYHSHGWPPKSFLPAIRLP